MRVTQMIFQKGIFHTGIRGWMLSKRERLNRIYEEINAKAPAASETTAFQQLCDAIKNVEDKCSGAPNVPQNWQDDGRLYPPQSDSIVESTQKVTTYRNARHFTTIGFNGAIQIKRKDGTVIFSKAGADGQEVENL